MTPIDALDAARKLLGVVLDFVPHDVAAQMLTDEAVRRGNAIANAAEAAKFGSEEDP